MAGIPRLNADLSITVSGENDDDVIDIIPACMLVRGGIGYFFERIVGLHYERAGYSVEYRSHLGYLDEGVDLIAHNEMQRRFIQCKFTLKSMPTAKVELLLVKASKFVAQNLGPAQNHFDLVIPFESVAFPLPKIGKNGKSKPTNSARLAFQRYNATQSRVRLHIVEIPIEIPELPLVSARTSSVSTDRTGEISPLPNVRPLRVRVDP